MAALVSPSVVNFPNDPYLQYQPAFAYTLPVQLLCAGVTLTLLVVLGIHLLCRCHPESESLYGGKVAQGAIKLNNSYGTIPLPPRTAQLLPTALIPRRMPRQRAHQDHRDTAKHGG